MQDKVLRGRLVIPDNKGERNPRVILTKSQVDLIRSAPSGTIKDLANSFGVSPSTAYAIRTGARWRE
jgi:hypothetical protein